MKITKSQKEAIVNEISRRLQKENQTITENFNKNYKFTKEEKEFLDACKEAEEFDKKWKNLNDRNNKLADKLGFEVYSWRRSDMMQRIINRRLLESKQIKSVDLSEIRDKLEFATLDPSFDVEEFIKNFI